MTLTKREWSIRLMYQPFPWKICSAHAYLDHGFVITIEYRSQSIAKLITIDNGARFTGHRSDLEPIDKELQVFISAVLEPAAALLT